MPRPPGKPDSCIVALIPLLATAAAFTVAGAYLVNWWI